MKIVIIGGVAGGASAAARLRRLDENAEIVIIERSGYISYANCGLPYYLSGTIEDKESLILQTPESFKNRFNIDVRVKEEVIEIDRKLKSIKIRRGATDSIYEESYDKLILSMGAAAIKPPFPGIDDPRIMTLKTVEDTFRISEAVKKNVRNAVVIGGGFIGLEVVENFMETGIDTTMIQLDPQILPQIDFDMAAELHSYLQEKGLKLRLNTAVTGFIPNETDIEISLNDHTSLSADLVVMAIGVKPESKLALDCGLKLNEKGAIVVNEFMQTSDPDIYGVGDVVETYRSMDNSRAMVALAGPANKQGRIAANHIAGRQTAYGGAQSSSIIKLFDMTAASTGITEAAAEQMDIPYDKIIIYPANHATYYPGAVNMTMKIIFHKENGTILGAQITGFDGVDKRIDVLATAIRAGMTAEDLIDLDLAYAPPYGSAKDPVNMAGYVIENVLNGTVEQYHWNQIPSLYEDENVQFLDVRTLMEYDAGHFNNTIHIPVDELRDNLEGLDKNKTFYVNCHTGLRSYIACRMLLQHGFKAKNLSGGFRFASFLLKEYISGGNS